MTWNGVSREAFLLLITHLDFKDDDEKESREFTGGLGIVEMYKHRANHDYAKYYIVKDNEKILVTIMLQRDGSLIYFTTKDFTPNLTRGVIRSVRNLANKTVRKVDNIFVKTAPWYAEAIRFVKIIGFTQIRVNKYDIQWIYER